MELQADLTDAFMEQYLFYSVPFEGVAARSRGLTRMAW
jgi:hypothetical protein